MPILSGTKAIDGNIDTYVYLDIHIYIYTYIHTYIHIYINTYAHTYTHTSYIYTHTYIIRTYITYTHTRAPARALVCLATEFYMRQYLKVQYAVGQMVETLPYKAKDRGFVSRWANI